MVLFVFSGRGLAAQEYAFRHYGPEVGVPRAYAVAFDGAGQLLVGTNEGILRFDGRAFEPVPLPAERAVWRLAAGPDGTVWSLTDRAEIVRLAPDGTAERIPAPVPVRDRLREAVWRHRIHTDERGRLWLSVGDGVLYRWEGPARRAWSARRVPGADRVGDFFFRGDGDNGTLVVAADRGVGEIPVRGGRLGSGRWTPTPARLWWVRPHPSARAWAGGAEAVYLLGHDGALQTVSPPGQTPWPHCEPGVDPDGRLLTLLEGRETAVVRFTPDGIIDLTTQDDRALSGLLANQLAFDPEGALWIAHQTGLATLQDEWAVAFRLEVGGHRATVFGMAGDAARGDFWVSTYGGGVFRFENGHFAPVDSDVGWVAFPPVLIGGGEAEWVETRGNHATSVLRSRGSQGTVQARPLVVHVGRGGRYETDEAGLWRVRDGRRQRLGATFLPGALGAEDTSGRLWIGGDPGRLDVVWGDTLGSTCPACLPPSLRNALDTLNESPTWFTVTPDAHGHVWAGGLSGLAVLWERTDGTWSHRLFGPEDGLLSRNVATSLSPDGQRLWVGTLRGIQGLRVRDGIPTFNPFVEIGGRDGLPGEAAGALTEDSDGFLWVYLRTGFVHRLDWRALADPPPSPGVRIARAQVNGRPAGLGTSYRLREGDDLVLGVWPRTYRRSERVRVEYRLDERAAWMSLGTGRQLALASVPAGSHTLEIRAVRPGRPPGLATPLALSVAAPFWRTWPFALLIGLAMAGALFSVHRVREGRRRATDSLRQRIAADLHDEMGGGLTQVSLYSELIRRATETGGDGVLGEDDGRVAAWAEHVGAQARALSESMRDVVWAIRPDESSWQDLELRLKDTAVALLAPRDIEPDLGGEVTDRPPPLPPEVRQNVLLFVKEALHNAVRHGSPARVEVRWRLTRRTLALRVCDDGCGFDPAAITPGMGLASLRRRADELGGSLSIDTAPGRGTCLSLDVPLRRRRLQPTRSGR